MEEIAAKQQALFTRHDVKRHCDFYIGNTGQELRERFCYLFIHLFIYLFIYLFIHLLYLTLVSKIVENNLTNKYQQNQIKI